MNDRGNFIFLPPYILVFWFVIVSCGPAQEHPNLKVALRVITSPVAFFLFLHYSLRICLVRGTASMHGFLANC